MSGSPNRETPDVPEIDAEKGWISVSSMRR